MRGVSCVNQHVCFTAVGFTLLQKLWVEFIVATLSLFFCLSLLSLLCPNSSAWVYCPYSVPIRLLEFIVPTLSLFFLLCTYSSAWVYWTCIQSYRKSIEIYSTSIQSIEYLQKPITNQLKKYENHWTSHRLLYATNETTCRKISGKHIFRGKTRCTTFDLREMC